MLNTQFKKGMIPWNKGMSPSDETRMRISETKKILYKEGKLINSTKGKSFEEIYGIKRAKEIKARCSQSHKGIQLSIKHRLSIGNSIKGHIVKDETRTKISTAHKGKHLSPNTEFKKGHISFKITKIKQKIKKSLKGKTYVQIYGKERAEKIILLHKKRMQIRIGKKWEDIFGYEKAKEMKLKLSKHYKDKTYEELLGNEQAAIKKAKISKSRKGKTYEQLYGVEKAKIKRLEKSKWRLTAIWPKKDTSIEIKIQIFLKELGYEYFTHQYIHDIKHGYQCDILIPILNLVIECDGNYWHKYPIGNELDHVRTKELIEKGFKVLRLWECDIKEMSIDKFKDRLKEA